MSELAFSVSGLTKRFVSRDGDGASRVVIDALDLDVRQGEFICILGPSGCGKSTFLNILAGLDREYEGHLSVRGTKVTRGRLPMRVAYVFQEPRLLPWLTAEQNVDFVMSVNGISREKGVQLKDEYFSMTGLQKYRKHFPHQMSGGMCQRLALVRALSIEPEILLMDEPFSGLDELTARRLRADLATIWERTGKTVIFVTHNCAEATFLADRVLIMSGGGVKDAYAIDIARPRDHDDESLFRINKTVLSSFLAIAGDAAN